MGDIIMRDKSVHERTFAIDIDGTITENGAGRIHLDALVVLRNLVLMGHKVIYVTGRSSVEGFLLSVFGGTTPIAVGENGGCITYGTNEHTLLGRLDECKRALDKIKASIDGVQEKSVFPRMTEIVLERTFDLDDARAIISENDLDVQLSDSQYAYHINSSGIDKGTGFGIVMERLGIIKSDVIAIGDSSTDIPLFAMADTSIALGNAFSDVKSAATMVVSAKSGDGVIEALDRLAPEL